MTLSPRSMPDVARRYRCLRSIGKGGHGEVWEAEDRLTGEIVAVKLFDRGFGAEPLRVRREIAALRLARLPGVVRLLDEGLEDGQAFLVMERVRGAPFPGAPLPLSWESIASMTLSLLETLARVHAAGIVHRDLKPENVLLSADGRPVLLDFGLSIAGSLGENLDEQGYLLGTPKYLAPEQIRGEAITPATDLYSVGVLVYETLAGRPPHKGKTLHELMAARLSGPPVPLAEIAPLVPKKVSAIVDRLLEIEQEARPQSALDVIAALRGESMPGGGARVVSNPPPRGLSTTALDDGLLEVRRARDRADAEHLAAEEKAQLASFAEMALLEGTPTALDRVLYEIYRSAPRTPGLERMEALVRAGLAFAAGSDRAFDAAEAVPALEEPGLERCRHGLRVLSARRISQERLDAVLAEVRAWAEGSDDPRARAALSGWLGRLAYQKGSFEQAAELHSRAAAEDPSAIGRLAALLHNASSWMEAFRFESAASVAAEALALAKECGHAHYEVRATWLLRQVAFRRGEPLAPDPAVAEAASAVGVPDLEALVELTEAAFAWRGGQKELAAELASRANRRWLGMKKQWAALLARSLVLASRGGATHSEVRAIAAEARHCPVHGLGIQMLGLCALARPESARSLARGAEPLAAMVPRAHWPFRMEVLSVVEARAALGMGEVRGSSGSRPRRSSSRS